MANAKLINEVTFRMTVKRKQCRQMFEINVLKSKHDSSPFFRQLLLKIL